jgi:hypothetical protein
VRDLKAAAATSSNKEMLTRSGEAAISREVYALGGRVRIVYGWGHWPKSNSFYLNLSSTFWVTGSLDFHRNCAQELR